MCVTPLVECTVQRAFQFNLSQYMVSEKKTKPNAYPFRMMYEPEILCRMFIKGGPTKTHDVQVFRELS